MTRSVNPVADEWTDTYTVFAASSQSVRLTEPLQQFVDYAVSAGLRPVLLTDAHADVSPFVTMTMLRAGGYWAARTATGAVFNALTGYEIRSFPELWEQPGTDRERLTQLMEVSPTPGGVLMFDVNAHQRASAQTLVGEMGRQLVRDLGGGELDVWGTAEPLTQPWDVTGVTEVVRAGMPDSPTVLARAASGSFCTTQVKRTPRGLLEHAKGGAAVGAYPFELEPAIERADAALRHLAETCQPTVGFVSLAEFDPGVVQKVAARRPEAPLAVIIGPRALHDMDADVDTIVRRHDATVLGRRRVPSVIVRFSDREYGLWAQLAYLTSTLGPGNVVAASGVMRAV